MTNVEKISEFLTQAKVFTFLTVDNGQPKGRPFGFHLVDGDRIYFGTATFKNCFKQLSADPHVEVMAVNDGKFMRYDGLAKIVKDDALLAKVHEAMPQLKETYDKNGWEIVLFYLENGHAEIRGLFEVEEEFDV
ncbi:TPA: pyridoxamine 5'-phosphate oxidase family protein [Campylobacter jejuni]|nr:pyridoxamine 5'-phosphate oxidase family protein [Campylobacter jejuni]HED0426684.1 pyridoxamine 5'-phosphate oxidase family protein [Campylobacter jejuni]HED1148408.1 pyridoxamine 5'-phosphate oxidase family protein [Campylobacter jejuni]HED1149966.1 pyridoxamine 5'-phosphate oxidase family protein [Campylobacter jejuni]HEG8412539.1 pyridoxamine 5'-phosphate oxidase family protein [Campylobacter jejuni]